MGNCQAAEVDTVVIQHPAENKFERIHWSVSAHEIMSKNPGHYIALVVVSQTKRLENGTTALNQLKLLRPDDILLIGHVYRLISFEDVLKEFAAKKCGKLGKLLKESVEMERIKKKKDSSRANQNKKTQDRYSFQVEKEICQFGNNGGISRGMGRRHDGPWRPALPSIAEIGN